MKKASLIIVIVVICLATVLATSACNFDKIIENIKNSGEGTADYSADDKYHSLGILEEVLAGSLNNPNMVVTARNGDSLYFTEFVVGDKDCTVYSDTDKVYAVKDGDQYKVIRTLGKSYTVGKDVYDENYCRFKQFIIKNVDEKFKDGTFSCTRHIEEKGEQSEGNFTFNYTGENGDSYQIVGSERNDLVQAITITAKQDGVEASLTLDFAYGSAAVTVPDITDYNEYNK